MLMGDFGGYGGFEHMPSGGYGQMGQMGQMGRMSRWNGNFFSVRDAPIKKNGKMWEFCERPLVATEIALAMQSYNVFDIS